MYIYSCVVGRRKRETVTRSLQSLPVVWTSHVIHARESQTTLSLFQLKTHPPPNPPKRNGHSCRYTFTLDRFFELECVLRDTEQLSFRIWWIWRWVLCKRNTVIREAAVRRLDAKVYRASRRDQEGRKTSFQRIPTPVQRFTRDGNDCDALEGKFSVGEAQIL